MKLVDLKEEYKAPVDIQDHVDDWIAGHSDSPELEEWINHAPPLQRTKKVWRVLFGQRAIDKWDGYKKGDRITFDRLTSTSETWEGLQEGVIAPNGGEDEYIILEIHMHAGKSFGRSIVHSNIDHPENIQDEFLIKKGVTFALREVLQPTTKTKTLVYVLMG